MPAITQSAMCSSMSSRFVIRHAVGPVEMVPVDFPVVVIPPGLLEASHEVCMEPVDCGQLIVVMLPRSFRDFAVEECQGLYDVPNVLPTGRQKCFLGRV